MREIISLHIGQPGIQIANPYWEQLCLEHDIRLDGSSSNKNSSNLQVLFSESQNRRFTPRAALFDGDQGAISSTQGGSLKKLFHPNFVHQLKMESGSIWPRAYNVKDEEIEEILKKLLEGCDSIAGIMVYHSISGGYGGGFTCRLLDILHSEATKSNKLTISIFPSELNQSVVEPYNSVLTLAQLQEYTDYNILLENDALYRICERHIEKPRFNNINQLIAQAASSFTSSIRFGGQRCVDFYGIRNHLIPLPKLQLLWCSYTSSTISLSALTQTHFDQRGAFIKFNRSIHKYIGSTLFYRANCSVFDLKQSISSIKEEFVNNEKKFQIAVSQPVLQGNSRMNKSVGMIANSTAVLRPLQLLKKRFQTLYLKRSFLHWYDGLEENQFKDSLEDITSYISLYKEQQGNEYSNDIFEEDLVEEEEFYTSRKNGGESYNQKGNLLTEKSSYQNSRNPSQDEKFQGGQQRADSNQANNKASLQNKIISKGQSLKSQQQDALITNRLQGQQNQKKLQDLQTSKEQSNFEGFDQNQDQQARLNGSNNLEEEGEFSIKKEEINEVRAANYYGEDTLKNDPIQTKIDQQTNSNDFQNLQPQKKEALDLKQIVEQSKNENSSGRENALKNEDEIQVHLSFVMSEIDQYRNKKFQQICSEAYEQTLAPYHTFLVRNAAKAAWLTAPERQKIFDIFAPKQKEEEAYAAMKEFLTVLEPMRENIWDYYKANNLLTLQ